MSTKKKTAQSKPRKVTAAAKPKPSAKPTKEPKSKRVSALDAAAKVLAGSDKPMRAADLVGRMKQSGLWSSPKGKTPEATLHASITREIAAKGKESRFRKAGRGLFALAVKGA